LRLWMLVSHSAEGQPALIRRPCRLYTTQTLRDARPVAVARPGLRAAAGSARMVIRSIIVGLSGAAACTAIPCPVTPAPACIVLARSSYTFTHADRSSGSKAAPRLEPIP
jgi:hypothetical protein